jgi:hypothetical protein
MPDQGFPEDPAPADLTRRKLLAAREVVERRTRNPPADARIVREGSAPPAPDHLNPQRSERGAAGLRQCRLPRSERVAEDFDVDATEAAVVVATLDVYARVQAASR